MKNCTIKFEVTAKSANDEFDEPCVVVAVSPLVNGTALLTSYTFDACEILAQGAVSASAHPVMDYPSDIFTCSCGVAGCAGLHEQSKVSFKPETVTWHFPKEYFPSLGEAGFPDEEGYFSITFEREHYFDALSDLLNAISAHQHNASLPLLIEPNPYLDGRKAIPIAQLIARVSAHLAEEADIKIRYGSLLEKGVEISHPIGKGTISLLDLTKLKAEEERKLGVDSNYLDEVVIPALRKDATLAFQLVRQLPWPLIRDYVYLDFDSADLDNEWPMRLESIHDASLFLVAIKP